MAPQAHLPDTIWRLKIISTDWLPGHPDIPQLGAGHISILTQDQNSTISPLNIHGRYIWLQTKAGTPHVPALPKELLYGMGHIYNTTQGPYPHC